MASSFRIFKVLSRNICPKSLLHHQSLCVTPTAATHDIKYPKYDMPSFHDVEMPENRELPEVPRIPQYYINMKPPRLRKSHTLDLRGPERVNNRLFYRQYGIIALSAGYLVHQHTDLITQIISKEMDKKRMFAIWRVDPLWKPITKKAIGKRMGGGKPNVHHYASPVKAGRIVIEVGGKAEFREAYAFLNRIAKKMPFDAIPISQEILEQLEKEATELHEKNINPFSFRYAVQNDLQGCNKWTSPWDFVHGGDYI